MQADPDAPGKGISSAQARPNGYSSDVPGLPKCLREHRQDGGDIPHRAIGARSQVRYIDNDGAPLIEISPYVRQQLYVAYIRVRVRPGASSS